MQTQRVNKKIRYQLLNILRKLRKLLIKWKNRTNIFFVIKLANFLMIQVKVQTKRNKNESMLT